MLPLSSGVSEALEGIRYIQQNAFPVCELADVPFLREGLASHPLIIFRWFQFNAGIGKWCCARQCHRVPQARQISRFAHINEI